MTQKRRRKAVPRTPIRLPTPMVDEVDRIVEENPLYINRQDLIEDAVREKIEKIKLIKREERAKTQSSSE